MRSIGFGIIGLGRMGSLHAQHLAGEIRGATLLGAAVDPRHKEALESAGDMPWSLADDAAALIANPDVEALVIASSSTVHQEHVTLAAQAGKPVFCEKPLADSVQGTLDAAAAVREAGIPFQIAFQRRFDAGYARTKELIAAGVIGEPEMFRGLSADRMPPLDYLRHSGGLFWDLGIHDYDAARFLMDDEVNSVHATGAILIEPRLAEFGDVDYGIITLKFARGGLGVIQNSWRAPAGYDVRAEVHGSLGKVTTELDEKTPTRLYTAGSVAMTRHFEFVERFRDAYRAELQSFVDALHTSTTPSPGIADAVAAMRIADAAARSHASSAWVEVTR
ncbi:MAG: inositol 2-dehydrogenase [Chloroflexia bacterium]|nr:inositol 2-dehydrogenase [Chloroflexia bacterium]